MYVVTDEDIRRSGAIDLPTVLRRIPGLEVMQMTGADFNVSARGDSHPFANKMLVMVDGRSIYLDVQRNVFWKCFPLTLPESKRIEMLKGPTSAVYGFNAFDGAINIITKSPEEMKGPTLQFGGGEEGTISSAAVHVGEVTSNSIRPSFGYANAVYKHGAFLVRAWWSGYTDHAPINPLPQWAGLVSVTDRNGVSTNPFSGNTYNVDVHPAVNVGSDNRLLYGATYRHNSLSSPAIDPFSRENRLALFLQDEWHAASAITVVAGTRYDLHTQITGTWSPRLAILYEPVGGHTFHLSGSAAYRPPTLSESHQDQRVTTTIPTGLPFPLPSSVSSTVPVTGSTHLAPERIISYEAGYQGWYWKHRVRVRADLFGRLESRCRVVRAAATT